MMKLIGRYLLAAVLVPVSVMLGFLGIVWHALTFQRARREYEVLTQKGFVAEKRS
jgi:hypothetical protein